jgi:anti-sigma factor RsiW
VKVLWWREQVVCQQWVELVTAYLEGALPPRVTKAIDRHLRWCPHCREYLKQMRLTIQLAGRLRDDQVPDEVLDAVQAAFRDLHHPGP